MRRIDWPQTTQSQVQKIDQKIQCRVWRAWMWLDQNQPEERACSDYDRDPCIAAALRGKPISKEVIG